MDGTDAEVDETLATAVRLHVLAVYERHGRVKGPTADALEVSLKTLYNHFSRWEREGHIRPVSGGAGRGVEYVRADG